jgi:urea transport system permease protein
MSLGLAITFGLMGVINMAHGELLMLGSYTAYLVQESFAAYAPGYLDYFFFVALPLSLLVVGTVGLCLEQGLLRFLYGRPLESLLVTWGIGLILQQGVRLSLGDQTSVNPPTWFRGGWEALPGLVLPYSRLFIVMLSVLSVIGVYWLLYRSTAGLKIRAVMQNRDIACCMGIAARRIDALTFAMGAALAGLAGCVLSLIGTVDPEVGKTYIVDSFYGGRSGRSWKNLRNRPGRSRPGHVKQALRACHQRYGGRGVCQGGDFAARDFLLTAAAHWALPAQRARDRSYDTLA